MVVLSHQHHHGIFTAPGPAGQLACRLLGRRGVLQAGSQQASLPNWHGPQSLQCAILRVYLSFSLSHFFPAVISIRVRRGSRCLLAGGSGADCELVCSQGVTWLAMLPMAAQWIPPADRSKFMSNMMGKFRIASKILRSNSFIIDVFFFLCKSRARVCGRVDGGEGTQKTGVRDTTHTHQRTWRPHPWLCQALPRPRSAWRSPAEPGGAGRGRHDVTAARTLGAAGGRGRQRPERGEA